MVIMRLEDIAIDEGVEHLATDWQISDRKDFATLAIQSTEDSTNKTSIVFQDVLDPTKTWYGRARVKLTTGWTVWGNLHVFNTTTQDTLESLADLPSRISVPQITTSSQQGNHTVTLFDINATGFETVGNSTHYATSWIIEDIDETVQWASLENSIYKTTINVSDIILKSDAVYRIKVMFHSSSGDISPVATYTIKTGDSSDIHLLTYIDEVDNLQPLQLAMSTIDGIEELTWRIYGFKKDIAYLAWEEKISNANYINTIVPANTLSEDSIYILQILPTSNTITSKFIPFKTLYKGGSSKDDTATVSFQPDEYAVRLYGKSQYKIPFTSDADEIQLILDNSKLCTVSNVDNEIVIDSKTVKTDSVVNLTVIGTKTGYKSYENTLTIDLLSDTSKNYTAVGFTVDPTTISLSDSNKTATITVDSSVSSTVRLGGYDTSLVTVTQTGNKEFSIEANRDKKIGSCVLTVICEQDKYASNTKTIQVNIPSAITYEADLSVTPSSATLSTITKEAHFTVDIPTGSTFTVESDDPNLFSVTKTSDNSFSVTANKNLTTGTNTVTVQCHLAGYDTSSQQITVNIPNAVVWPADFSLSPASVTLTNDLLQQTINVIKPQEATFDVVSNSTNICTVGNITSNTFDIIGNKNLITGSGSVTVTCKESGVEDSSKTIPVSIPEALSWPVDFTISPSTMVITNSTTNQQFKINPPSSSTVLITSNNPELFTIDQTGNNLYVNTNSKRLTGTGEFTVTVSKEGYLTSTKTGSVTIAEPLNDKVSFNISATNIALSNHVKTYDITVDAAAGANWSVVSNDTTIFDVEKIDETTFRVKANKLLNTGTATFTVTCIITGYSMNFKSGTVSIASPVSWPVELTGNKDSIILSSLVKNDTITLEYWPEDTNINLVVNKSETGEEIATGSLKDKVITIKGNTFNREGSSDIVITGSKDGYQDTVLTIPLSVPKQIYANTCSNCSYSTDSNFSNIWLYNRDEGRSYSYWNITGKHTEYYTERKNYYGCPNCHKVYRESDWYRI